MRFASLLSSEKAVLAQSQASCSLPGGRRQRQSREWPAVEMVEGERQRGSWALCRPKPAHPLGQGRAASRGPPAGSRRRALPARGLSTETCLWGGRNQGASQDPTKAHRATRRRRRRGSLGSVSWPLVKAGASLVVPHPDSTSARERRAWCVLLPSETSVLRSRAGGPGRTDSSPRGSLA